MIHNHLYTDHRNIMARLSHIIKTKHISESSIIEWCQEVEIDIIQDVDNMYRYVEYELPVENHRVFLPCYVYKILDVYTTPGDASTRVDYYKNGGYISLASNTTLTSVYVDFIGSPVDLDTGIPLIIRGHEIACEAYCIWKMFFEDILMDKLSIDSKNRIEIRKDNELAACLSTSMRHKDRQALNRDMIIRGNWVPRLANIGLIGNDIIQ